jgi:hypothetical protein
MTHEKVMEMDPRRPRESWAGALFVVLAVVGGCDPDSTGTGLGPEGEPDWVGDVGAAQAIGGSDREGGEVTAISDAVFLSDGVIAVGDRFDLDIKVFAIDGRHLATFGREGAGPGEFLSLRALSRVDDERVAVWDPQLRRITTVHLAKGVVETASLTFRGFDELIPTFVGAMGDHGWIFRDRKHPGGRVEGTYRETAAFLLLSPDGEHREVLIELEGDERFAQPWQPRETISGIMGGRVFLGSRLLAGAHESGLVLARTDSTDLVLVDDRGITAQYASPGRGEPLSSEVVEEAHQAMIDSIASSPIRSRVNGLTDRELRLESARVAPIAEVAPAFSRVLVAADGTTWLQSFDRLSASHQDWWQHDADLEVLRGVRLPATVEVLDILRDQVLAVRTDELGVEILLVVPIHRRSDEPPLG